MQHRIELIMLLAKDFQSFPFQTLGLISIATIENNSRLRIWWISDPNSNGYFFFFVSNTYMKWCDDTAPRISLSPLFDSKMDLWQQSSNNLLSACFMNLALTQEVTLKSFNLLLKRIYWTAFKFKFKGIKMYKENEKGARL